MRTPAHIADSAAQPAAVGGVLQRACACGGSPGPTGECAECRRKKTLTLQPKLTINEPGDQYEQEADRVAAAVVQGAAAELSQPVVPPIQRLQRQESGQSPFDFNVPGPSVGPAVEEEQKDPFEGVGMSKRWGDLVTTWGWGAPETNNIYHECQIAPLKRKDFVGFVKSLPQKQHKRKKPLDAEEVLGVTHFNPNDAVPPTFEAESAQEDGRTAYRVKPTHAEMPPIRSAATQAEQYTEGVRRFAGAPCVQAGIQNSKGASRVQWNLTADGAEKIAQAEQEHCDDILVAFNETLALYASMINRKAASMRTYATEQAAVNDAKAEVGLDHMQMLEQFYLTALRTEKRDTNHWHTANHKLPTLQHRQRPTFDNGCQHHELIDGRSMPEVGPKDSRPHSSYDVVLQPARSPGAPPSPATAPAIVHDVLQAQGQAMDAGTRGFMERRFGYDFGAVRIHTDAQAAASAQAVNAHAYTVGRNVVFAANQYAPYTHDGQRLLAHELTHVVQQGARPVQVQREDTEDTPPAIDREAFAQMLQQAVTALGSTEAQAGTLAGLLHPLAVSLADPANLAWQGADGTMAGGQAVSFTPPGTGATALDVRLVLSEEVDPQQRGLFSPSDITITLYVRRIGTAEEMQDVLYHELLHLASYIREHQGVAALGDTAQDQALATFDTALGNTAAHTTLTQEIQGLHDSLNQSRTSRGETTQDDAVVARAVEEFWEEIVVRSETYYLRYQTWLSQPIPRGDQPSVPYFENENIQRYLQLFEVLRASDEAHLDDYQRGFITRLRVYLNGRLRSLLVQRGIHRVPRHNEPEPTPIILGPPEIDDPGPMLRLEDLEPNMLERIGESTTRPPF